MYDFLFLHASDFFGHTKRVASVPSHHPKNSTTPHPILPLPYISPPILRSRQKKRHLAASLILASPSLLQAWVELDVGLSVVGTLGVLLLVLG
jgi:hypothetical protein